MDLLHDLWALLARALGFAAGLDLSLDPASRLGANSHPAHLHLPTD